MDEQSRTDANSNEQAFTLTVEDTVALYEQAGVSRTPRAIQKLPAMTCFASASRRRTANAFALHRHRLLDISNKSSN